MTHDIDIPPHMARDKMASGTIIARLSDAIELESKQRLEQHHRDGQPSDTGLKLIYEPLLAKLSDVGDNLHMDSRTLTLLFYDKWSLHAYPPSQGFAFPAPLEDGCALVNVADWLQRLSGNKLILRSTWFRSLWMALRRGITCLTC